MSSQRSVDGRLRRFDVSDLAHHDYIRVVPQDRTQASCKCQAGLGIGLYLTDRIKPEFDGVFDSDDMLVI